jgi:proteasome-associated ATPase
MSRSIKQVLEALQLSERGTPKAEGRRATPTDRHREAIAECGNQVEKLHELASHLAAENEQLRRVHQEVAEQHRALQEEVDAITRPEQHRASVTRVERNGEVVAEVCGDNGIGHRWVSVHPEVDDEVLCVGDSVLLTKNRACILRVVGEAMWDCVATYQRSLDDECHILVRYREEQIPLALADSLLDVEFEPGDEIGFELVSRLALERLESDRDDQLFEACPPEADFAQLGGLDAVVAQLRHIVELHARPDLVKRYGLRMKGILLQGPPGNGKTTLGRCLASYITRRCPDRAAKFMYICGGNDNSMWWGATEATTRRRFAAARKQAETGFVVIYWDEFDAVAKRRAADPTSGISDRILNTILGELDGLRKLENVLVIASTNRAEMLDPAAIREGRFDVKLYIPSPNRAAARQILHNYLTKRAEVLRAGEQIDEIVGAEVARIYSPRSPLASLATVRFSDGTTQTIHGKELVSGAMLEAAVALAGEAAAIRELEGGETGIAAADLTRTLDLQLHSTAALLTPSNVKAYIRTIPQDSHPVAVIAAGSGSRGA